MIFYHLGTNLDICKLELTFLSTLIVNEGIPMSIKDSAAANRELAAMSQIVWTIPRICHRLTGVGERIYSRFNLTAGKRSLLNDLVVQGPHTIAQMVRVRPPVTRQYIQRLVAELRRDDMVELSESPDDRRSKIVRLTENGRAVVNALVPAEQTLVKLLAAKLDAGQLEAARTVLVTVADRLEDSEFWARQLGED
jgi:DNA-binding MarR family transcriptional regulator